LPCGFKDFYGIYILGKEGVFRLKMTIDKTKYIIIYSNFFTYYEQDMFIKVGMRMVNNVYNYSGKKKLKEVITIDMAQERLRRLNKFGWSIT